MPKKPAATHRSSCPICVSLDHIGDSWSLLIVRDLLFKGRQSFNDLLTSGEGIATNILSSRLARLEAQGIVIKTRDADDARRVFYTLTEKGTDLGPILLELALWSAKHEKTAATPEQIREMRSNPKKFLARMKAANSS